MKRYWLVACLSLLSSGLLSACSSITVLRTSEIKAVGEGVRNDLRVEIDSLQQVVDSLREENLRFANRLRADLAILNARIVEEGDNGTARMEEILYRLDLLMNKSERILSKRVVVNRRDAEPVDSSAQEAQQLQEMKDLYNTARTDYHRGEFKLAYGAFKQVFETVQTGELAENALYWMALCMQDAGQTDNAQKLFVRVIEQFPDGTKACVVLYKLSTLSQAAGNTEMQKHYLQRLLAVRRCADSNEFLRGAQELQELLATPATEVPADSSAESSSSAAVSSSSAETSSSAVP